ncbi:MAG: hypothetical protein HOC95_02680 [Candidatus Diapherotrites archaeon]|nr:hypothetical protein [Candidatus Diapherotrites archaeon]
MPARRPVNVAEFLKRPQPALDAMLANVRKKRATGLAPIKAIAEYIPRVDATIIEHLPNSPGRSTAIKIVKRNPDLVLLTKFGAVHMPSKTINSIVHTVADLSEAYTRAGGAPDKIKASLQILSDAGHTTRGASSRSPAGGISFKKREIDAIKTIFALRMSQLLGRENYSLFVRASKQVQPLLRNAVMLA